MKIANYDTDFTDTQWHLLRRFLPKRWGVERTCGWLMHCRRLVRDHEQTVASAAGWIYLAMTRLMLRRLA